MSRALCLNCGCEGDHPLFQVITEKTILGNTFYMIEDRLVCSNCKREIDSPQIVSRNYCKMIDTYRSINNLPTISRILRTFKNHSMDKNDALRLISKKTDRFIDFMENRVMSTKEDEWLYSTLVDHKALKLLVQSYPDVFTKEKYKEIIETFS